MRGYANSARVTWQRPSRFKDNIDNIRVPHELWPDCHVAPYVQSLMTAGCCLAFCITLCMRQSPASVNQLGCAGKKQGREQTVPPSIPVAELFSHGKFPEGERVSYNNGYAFPLSLICNLSPCPSLVLGLGAVQLCWGAPLCSAPIDFLQIASIQAPPLTASAILKRSQQVPGISNKTSCNPAVVCNAVKECVNSHHGVYACISRGLQRSHFAGGSLGTGRVQS